MENAESRRSVVIHRLDQPSSNGSIPILQQNASSGPISSQNTTSNLVNSCPALPTELWGQIFTHVDDVDLWFTCRQVSQLLRSEAEREMAAHRLPKLDFCWRLKTKIELHGDFKKFWGIMMKPQLAKSTDDHRRVLYNFQLGFQPDPANEKVEEELRRFMEYKLDSLKVSDLEFNTRDDRLEDRRLVYINNTINEIEIPGMEIDLDRKELSFEWRPFLDHFFAEAAYIRQNNPYDGPTELELLGKAEQALKEQGKVCSECNLCQWLEDNEDRDHDTGERAYGLRLERAFDKVGLDLELGSCDQAIRSHCLMLEGARRRMWTRHFMKKRGYTEFQEYCISA